MLNPFSRAPKTAAALPVLDVLTNIPFIANHPDRHSLTESPLLSHPKSKRSPCGIYTGTDPARVLEKMTGLARKSGSRGPDAYPAAIMRFMIYSPSIANHTNVRRKSRPYPGGR
jgi:hypothetical protein